MPVISSGDVSGVNWMRLNLRAEHVRHGASEQRLGASGRALDQHVALRERGDEQQVDSVALADDDLADLLPRAVAQVDEVLVWRACTYDIGPLLGSLSRTDDTAVSVQMSAPGGS